MSESRDPLPPDERSRIMRAVRREDTAPELVLRRALWKRGLRYRKHRRIADTCPDVSFIGPKIAIFVDGCFWHGCPEHFKPPKSRTSYWLDKIRRNQVRDRRNDLQLEEAGWTVRRYWECEVEAAAEGIATEIERLLTPA